MKKANKVQDNKKLNRTFIETPKGTVVFANLARPSQFGKYDVTIKLDKEEAEKVFKSVLSDLDDSFETFKLENPKKKVLLKDLFTEDEEDDSVVLLKAASTYAPLVVDRKAEVLKNVPNIGKDSVVKLNVGVSEPTFFSALNSYGCSVRLYGVQVLSLKEFGGGGANPFKASSEGDYEYEDDGQEDSGDDNDDDEF